MGGRRGVEMKWRRRFLPSQSWDKSSYHPPSLYFSPFSPLLVCGSCCSGDMAAGFSPDCRNISSVAESGIAGKDNENRREVEGKGEGGGQASKEMDFF